MYLIEAMAYLGCTDRFRLNPYSNGTMYLISKYYNER